MHNSSDQMMGIIAAVIAFYAVMYLVGVAIITVPSWFICKKAGFSPWLSFINLVPGFGVLILLYILAFAEWSTLPPPPPIQAWTPPMPPPPQA